MEEGKYLLAAAAGAVGLGLWAYYQLASPENTLPSSSSSTNSSLETPPSSSSRADLQKQSATQQQQHQKEEKNEQQRQKKTRSNNPDEGSSSSSSDEEDDGSSSRDVRLLASTSTTTTTTTSFAQTRTLLLPQGRQFVLTSDIFEETTFGDADEGDEDQGPEVLGRSDDGEGRDHVEFSTAMLESLVQVQVKRRKGDPTTCHPACVGLQVLGSEHPSTNSDVSASLVLLSLPASPSSSMASSIVHVEPPHEEESLLYSQYDPTRCTPVLMGRNWVRISDLSDQDDEEGARSYPRYKPRLYSPGKRRNPRRLLGPGSIREERSGEGNTSSDDDDDSGDESDASWDRIDLERINSTLNTNTPSSPAHFPPKTTHQGEGQERGEGKE